MTRKYLVDEVLGTTASLKPTQKFSKRENKCKWIVRDYLPGSLENTDAVLFYWQKYSQPKNKSTFLDWKQYANR